MNTKSYNNYINCSLQGTNGNLGRKTPVFAVSAF